MKRLGKICLPLAAHVALAAAFLAQPAQAGNVQNLYVFGDSLSDNGNLFIVSNETYPPSSTYFDGHASNGVTWTERLGYQLGYVPDARQRRKPDGGFTSRVRGYNFAHYGATMNSDYAPSNGQSITRQVQRFAQFVEAGKLTVSPNDRFTIWGNANDFLAYGESDANHAAGQVKNRVRKLATTGAQNILVLDQPLWGNTPIGYNRGDRNYLNALMSEYNSDLEIDVRQLYNKENIDVYLAPVSELYLDVYLHPASYGFTVVAPKSGTSGHCVGDNLKLGACPSTYAFYDSIHPSAAMHELIADYVSAQFLSIDASKAYSGVAVSAASPALSMQALAISGDLSLATPSGWTLGQSGSVQTFAFSDLSLAADSGFQDAMTSLTRDDAFSLVGVRMPVGEDTRLAFALSSGTPENHDLTAHPVEAASGWAIRLERDMAGLVFGLTANGIDQSLSRARATGFARDPVVTAHFEQEQALTMLTVGRSAELAGLQLEAEAGYGVARQNRSGIHENGLTELVTRDTASEHLLDEVALLRVSATHSADRGDMHFELGAALSGVSVNGEAYSAWTVMGASDYASTDRLASSEAVEASLFSSVSLGSSWDIGARLSAGRSDIENVNAGRISLSYHW